MTDGMVKQLLWRERFGGDALHGLDDRRWAFDLGDGSDKNIPGWGNNEREFYTRESVTCDSGLKILAKRATEENSLEAYYGPAEWTSGRIHTADKVSFRYGYFSIRAKVPTGGGTWPAIWMLGTEISSKPWPSCGEIDIFEGTGNDPRIVRGSLHGPGYAAEKGITGFMEYEEDLSNEYHVYGLLWLPDRLEWYFDDRQYFLVKAEDVKCKGQVWAFDSSHFLLLNLAIGGAFSGGIAKDLKEAEFRVESIDFYSVDGIGGVWENNS